MATMHTPPSESEKDKPTLKEHTGKSLLSSNSWFKKWMAIPIILLVAVVGVAIVRFSNAANTIFGVTQFTNVASTQIQTKSNGTKYVHVVGSTTYDKSAVEVRTSYGAGVAVPAENYCANFGTPPTGTTAAMFNSNLVKDSSGNLPALPSAATLAYSGTKPKQACSTSGAVTAAANKFGVVRVMSLWVKAGQANVMSFELKSTGVDYTVPPAGTPTVRVKIESPVTPTGAYMVDGSGKKIQLRGVNRAGMEYQCYGGNQAGFISSGQFNTDHPGTKLEYAETVAAALTKWDVASKSGHAINTVRIPLNEECWLGINSSPAAYSGANYIKFVQRLTYNLSAQGMYVVLDNHRSSYGSHKADSQGQGPNADHSIEFWRQVGVTFKNYPNVMYDLFNEPNLNCYKASDGGNCPYDIVKKDANGNFVDYYKGDDWAWNIYLKGGVYKNTSSSCRANYANNPDINIRNNPPCDWIDDHPDRMGETWTVAGTQQLTNAIRDTGAMQPVMIELLGGGSGYLDGAGSHMPTDAKGKSAYGSEQVIVSAHAYDFGGLKTGTTADNNHYATEMSGGRKAGGGSEWGAEWAINGHYPFYMGEFGELMDSRVQVGTNPDGTPKYDNNNDSGYPCIVGGSTMEGGAKGNFTQSTIDFLEKNKYPYTAWGWDQQEGCHGPSLVRRGDNDAIRGNDNGDPTTYGARVKAGLQARQGL